MPDPFGVGGTAPQQFGGWAKSPAGKFAGRGVDLIDRRAVKTLMSGSCGVRTCWFRVSCLRGGWWLVPGSLWSPMRMRFPLWRTSRLSDRAIFAAEGKTCIDSHWMG